MALTGFVLLATETIPAALLPQVPPTIALAIALVPDAPGQAAHTRAPLRRVITIPGVLPVLAIITTWMVAHNTVYTYLAPYLHDTGTPLPIGVALVTFGFAALIGLA